MITETARRLQPWYRDPGVQASTAFSVAVLAFNAARSDSVVDQVGGLFAASPLLAAVLVQRVERVLIASVIATVAFLGGSALVGMEFDAAQGVRLSGMVVTSVVGLAAAQSRLREQRRMMALGEVAKTAQRAIMRIEPPKVDGVDAAVRYVSASTEANIGGDAYEAVLTPFGLRVLVADARGKGLPAVLTSAVAVGAFREWAYVEEDLGALICRMDASVGREVGDADFVTALVAEFENDSFRYVCAGHPKPVLLRDGVASELDVEASPPLSLIAGSHQPVVRELTMKRDDVVFLFSDGLSDSRNHNGDFFGVSEALLRVVEHAADVEECADGVLLELKNFVEGDLDDDVALVALRVTDSVDPLVDVSQK